MQEFGYSPGERCGDYRIIRLLGRGGYADVYQAAHVDTEDVVALKCLKPQHVDSARTKERLLAEARLFAAISHTNVVRVTKAGSDRGIIWMAMEFLDGCTLRDTLKAARGALPVVKALYFVREIADGVSALHEMRVVHRDLKPENVMVTTKGAVKVLDAGAGKFFGWDVQSTGPLGAVGTPLYMAPEHILGETVDARTDVYALGLILYELITGRHPFAQDPDRQASQLDVIAWQLHAVPPPLASIVRDFPPSISALVERAMAKKRIERHDTMTELAQALRVEWQRWLQECPGNPELIGVVAGVLVELNQGGFERRADHQENSSVRTPGAGTMDPLPALACETPPSAALEADEAVTMEIERAMVALPKVRSAAIEDASEKGPTSELQGSAAPLSHRVPPNGTQLILHNPWSHAGHREPEAAVAKTSGMGARQPTSTVLERSLPQLAIITPLYSRPPPVIALPSGTEPRTGLFVGEDPGVTVLVHSREQAEPLSHRILFPSFSTIVSARTTGSARAAAVAMAGFGLLGTAVVLLGVMLVVRRISTHAPIDITATQVDAPAATVVGAPWDGASIDALGREAVPPSTPSLDSAGPVEPLSSAEAKASPKVKPPSAGAAKPPRPSRTPVKPLSAGGVRTHSPVKSTRAKDDPKQHVESVFIFE